MATRATFHIVPSKGGETSSEARTAQVRIPSGSRPILPAAIPPRHYSDLRNSEVSLPLHSKRICKVIADPGFLSHVLSGTSIPSFPHLLTSSNSPCTKPIRVSQKKLRIYWSRSSKIQHWRMNPSPAPYLALSRGSNP